MTTKTREELIEWLNTLTLEELIELHEFYENCYIVEDGKIKKEQSDI